MQAVRSNGHILASDYDKGLIYDIDPKSNNIIPSVVAILPQGSNPAGIAEVASDVFYINNALGDAATFTTFPNTSSIWKLDMNQYSNTGHAALSKVLDIPDAEFLNGIVTVSQQDGVIFSSDSSLGVVFQINVYTSSYKIVLDHPYFKPNNSASIPVGINGLRIANSRLYFCNTNFGYLGTIALSSTNVPQLPPQLISSNVFAADDFDIDQKGNVWQVENVRNQLVRVTPNGQVDVIAGGDNSTDLLGPVSARFGRSQDRDVLYISTDGLTFDADGNLENVPARIAKIDTRTGWTSWSHLK